jgi:hypothetical protein
MKGQHLRLLGGRQRGIIVVRARLEESAHAVEQFGAEEGLHLLDPRARGFQRLCCSSGGRAHLGMHGRPTFMSGRKPILRF